MADELRALEAMCGRAEHHGKLLLVLEFFRRGALTLEFMKPDTQHGGQGHAPDAQLRCKYHHPKAGEMVITVNAIDIVDGPMSTTDLLIRLARAIWEADEAARTVG